jgi:CRISPR/Cas system-associated endoribonuclease Cas2
MKKQILPLLNKEQDSLRIYRICDTCRRQIKSFGIKKSWDDIANDQVIVV